MARLHSSKPHIHAATAWLLAFVWLWMGTVGVLHHTDALENGRSASAQPGLGHRAALLPAADSCAACEWTQGLQGTPIALCALQTPLTALDTFSLRPNETIYSRLLLHRSSRAPPVFLI